MARAWALGDLLATLFERRPAAQAAARAGPLPELCRALLSGRGEVSGMKLAGAVLARWRDAGAEERAAFFRFLADDLDLDPAKVAEAASAYGEARDAARLRALLGQIGDGAVRDHYRAALAERRAALFRPEGAGRGGMGRGAGFGAGFGGRGAWTPRAGKWTRAAPPPEGPLAGTKASALARAGAAGTRGREAAILLALMRHPSLIETCAEEIAATEFNQPDLDLLRRALISAAADGATEPAALAARMDAAAGRDAAAALAAAAPIGFAGADAALAETGLREALARRQAEQALAREVAEAEAALGAGDDAGLEIDGRLKLAAAAAQRELPGATITEDGDEAHLSEALRLAIEREIWVKKPRRRGDSPK